MDYLHVQADKPWYNYYISDYISSVVVDSCTKSSLVLTLTDAEDGGITYIQGQGASCRQNTVSGTSQHTFDFASCGIAWVSLDWNYSPNHI